MATTSRAIQAKTRLKRTAERKDNMSEHNKTKEEYIAEYAHDYCCDNKEEAKKHEIVKEVCEELKEE